MASKLAFAPDLVKASLPTSKIRSRFRCASARGFRWAGCEVLLGIAKNQKKLATGGYLRLSYVLRRHSPFYASRARLSIGTSSSRPARGEKHGADVWSHINHRRSLVRYQSTR